MYKLIVTIGGALIIAALFMYVNKILIPSSRKLTTKPDGTPTMKYPWPYFWFYMFGFIFFAGLGVAVIIEGEENIRNLIIGLAIISILFLIPAVFSITDKFEIRADVLHFRTLFRGIGEIRWSEIRNVTYSDTWQFFKLRTESGKSIRIFVNVTSLSEFAKKLLATKEAFKISAYDFKILKQTADGNPPKIRTSYHSGFHGSD